MDEPVRVYIERVKAALGVKTDEEMAKALGISKQAIANWRRRNKIPFDIDVRITDAYGPEFARSEITREVSYLRENEIVYAATFYAVSKYEGGFGRDLEIIERLAIGYFFKEIESCIRAEIREIGFEGETRVTIMELMMALIETQKIPKLNAIFKKLNHALGVA